ncbi:MAG: hypothetical protein JO276_17400 [Sphingomonadaceae bacterium]|nr:hypothetical protein [Sphingomonadaceae bacterium]
MPMLIVFIVGWFGQTWWPGIEVDAPRPGGGDPWWLRVLAGVVAGVVAVVVVQVTHTSMDTLLGVTLALATGKVTGVIIGALAGMTRK